jgi:hypothetical protein
VTRFRIFNKRKLGLLSSLFPTAAVLYNFNEDKKRGTLFSCEEKQDLSFEAQQNIFLASNSLIYAIDKISTATKLPPIVVLVPMWLEKVHHSHYDHKWGQTPLGLSEPTRALFYKLYPDYPNDEYVTWKQMLEVRRLGVAELEKLDKQGQIILYDLRAANIKQYEDGNLLNFQRTNEDYIMSINGGPSIKIPIDRLGMVYNFLTLPREVAPEQRKLGLFTRPHTELYYLQPDQIPKNLIIGGSGLSTVWLRKHFPTVENLFVIARNRGSKLPRIPSNESVDYSSIKLVTYDDLLINKVTGDFAIQDPLTRTLVEDINPAICFYSAIGYVSNEELTSCIPQKHKMTTEAGANLEWVAPKNIPVGTLTERLMKFYYRSEWYGDLNHVYEMQYYTDGVTPMQLQKKLKIKNIELPPNFFDRLGKVIKNLDNPVETEQEIDLYMESFMVQKPSSQEQKLFSMTIEEMQQEIKNRSQYLHEAQQTDSSNDDQSPKL